MAPAGGLAAATEGDRAPGREDSRPLASAEVTSSSEPLALADRMASSEMTSTRQCVTVQGLFSKSLTYDLVYGVNPVEQDQQRPGEDVKQVQPRLRARISEREKSSFVRIKIEHGMRM